MTSTTLHYIHDPLCGWCYGAAPLVKAAREVLPVVAHAGGMMTGARRQHVTPQLRTYVMQHDRRIAQISGQPFGDAYFEGLLRDTSAVFDSEPPITAMLAAESLGGRGLDMLARLQVAHYVDGKRIADAAVLRAMAVEIGLEGEAFDAAYAQQHGEATRAHIAASLSLLTRTGGSGFPTFVLERAGQFSVVAIQSWFGRALQWQEWLRSQAQPIQQDQPAGAMCGIDGCLP
jgi:putative protein-disulfide isomerase